MLSASLNKIFPSFYSYSVVSQINTIYLRSETDKNAELPHFSICTSKKIFSTVAVMKILNMDKFSFCFYI